jgi:uncharacterized protein with HEPN domain
MNRNENQLYKEFEKEIWLYLDKELSDERQVFWDKKLQQNQSLQNYLNEYLALANDYKQSVKIDVDEYIFDLMIENAISKNSLFNRVKQFVRQIFSTETDFNFGKIAFASFLIIAAVVFSIISNRSNPVDNFSRAINTQLLDWNPKYFQTKVDKIENLLKLTKDEDYKKYYMYGVPSQNIDKNINLIGKNIDELKKEIKTKDL